MRLRALVGITVSLGVLTGCTGDPDSEPETKPVLTPATVATEDAQITDADLGAYEEAASRTREDSYYPHVGDPGVDTLHHNLKLRWNPETHTLTGRDAITFRATTDADEFQLDLSPTFKATKVRIEKQAAETTHEGKDLVIHHPVTKNEVYKVVIGYRGKPEPVRAPTRRDDIPGLGFTLTSAGNVWTMQEPYGAYTWYPVNDQPADKAFYDVAITVPDPLVGVSNGTLTERTTKNGRTTTKFHNTDPMASYLVTLGIGDYTHETDETASGTPLNYWVLPEQHDRLARLRVTKQALEWVETKLGDYPFDSAGVLLTESTSGMETQTLITLGDTDYATSPPVLVHELVHQWYGNLVGPTDWRDLWMNEGMAMYLQAVFEAKHGGPSLRATIEGWRANDSFLRGDEGPPGAYDPHAFGGSIVYTSPAVMWADLREQIGDDAFWELVRAWPEVAPDTATREEYLAWIEATTGDELTAFFDRWLTGESTPG